MTRLEIAKNKLERLRREASEANQRGRAESKKIPFGQPNIIGRRDIYKDANRHYDKSIKLQEEADRQEDRVEMLEKVEEFKEKNELLKDVIVKGKTAYARIGAKTSVNNLDYFKDKLEKLIAKNEEAKAYNKAREKTKMKYRTYGTEITALKRKIQTLEKMQEKAINDKHNISEKSQHLIETGQVNQWKKKPIYYFVKGLQKVALEIDEFGEFKVSWRYAPVTEEDKIFVENLIRGN